MTTPKDFDFKLAFISGDSRLSHLKPQEALADNPFLSKMMVYIYTILKHYGDTIRVEDSMYNYMMKLFPYAGIENKNEANNEADEESRIYWVVDEVVVEDSNKRYSCHEGEIYMPAYVGATSNIVYNIYNNNSQIENITSDYISLALNFYNCVVRSETSGVVRVAWRNSITFGGELVGKKYGTYDYAFGIYLADKYIQSMDPYYIDDTPINKLAMCMSFMDGLEIMSTEMESTVVIRPISEPFIRELLVSDLDYQVTNPPGIVKVDTDTSNAVIANIASALVFAGKDIRPNNLRIYITGFSNYNNLGEIANRMKSSQFVIWSHAGGKTPSTKNITYNPKPLTNALLKSGKVDILISANPANQPLIKGWSGVAVVKFDSTPFKSYRIYPSLFTQSIGNGFAFVDQSIRERGKDASATREAFASRINKLNTEYRDTKKWLYTVDGSAETKTYDQVVLESLLESLPS